jgi:hypothetical protein
MRLRGTTRSTGIRTRIQNPAKRLTFELKTKGVQYFPALEEWQAKIK